MAIDRLSNLTETNPRVDTVHQLRPTKSHCQNIWNHCNNCTKRTCWRPKDRFQGKLKKKNVDPSTLGLALKFTMNPWVSPVPARSQKSLCWLPDHSPSTWRTRLLFQETWFLLCCVVLLFLLLVFLEYSSELARCPSLCVLWYQPPGMSFYPRRGTFGSCYFPKAFFTLQKGFPDALTCGCDSSEAL